MVRLLLDDYEINNRKSIRTVGICCKKLDEMFSGFQAIAITADKIMNYIKLRRNQGMASATIRKHLAALKRMFTLAKQNGMLSRRPHIPSIQVSNARQGFFEETDLMAVLQYLPEYIQPVVRFGYLTGWRKGEILSLTWAQVDFRNSEVRLEPGTTKNNEGRTLLYGNYPELAEVINSQRIRTRKIEHERGIIIPWVFHRNGERITDIRDAWNIACKKAGLQGRIFHDFRRTAVRNLERAGVSRSVAMKLTGHKTESVYQRYAIVSKADLSEGVAKLSQLATGPQRSVVNINDGKDSLGTI